MSLKLQILWPSGRLSLITYLYQQALEDGLLVWIWFEVILVRRIVPLLTSLHILGYINICLKIGKTQLFIEVCAVHDWIWKVFYLVHFFLFDWKVWNFLSSFNLSQEVSICSFCTVNLNYSYLKFGDCRRLKIGF